MQYWTQEWYTRRSFTADCVDSSNGREMLSGCVRLIECRRTITLRDGASQASRALRGFPSCVQNLWRSKTCTIQVVEYLEVVRQGVQKNPGSVQNPDARAEDAGVYSYVNLNVGIKGSWKYHDRTK